jgi:NitT/TauT family transport system permease protein
MKPRHIHHDRQHGFSYPVSLAQRVYTLIIGPLIVLAVVFIIVKFLSIHLSATDTISGTELFSALLYTCMRLLIAYACALIVAIPLALLAVTNSVAEAILLPIFDILESIPVLAFFPVLILVFVRFNFLNGAAIFILFLAMLWNIVFTVVGGLKIIPRDITYAARVFGLHGSVYFRRVILPAVVPQIVTGSILAVAQGWNLIIVAEVLHVYLPNGTANQDLVGIGSILVRSAANGQTTVFASTLTIMILTIALLNFFVWQKLLHYAQRYKFE